MVRAVALAQTAPLIFSRRSGGATHGVALDERAKSCDSMNISLWRGAAQQKMAKGERFRLEARQKARREGQAKELKVQEALSRKQQLQIERKLLF